MKAKSTIGKIYVSQCLFRAFCKHFVEDFKLQFIFLIGGRVCNPRQQQNALNIYNMLLPRVENPPPN